MGQWRKVAHVLHIFQSVFEISFLLEETLDVLCWRAGHYMLFLREAFQVGKFLPGRSSFADACPAYCHSELHLRGQGQMVDVYCGLMCLQCDFQPLLNFDKLLCRVIMGRLLDLWTHIKVLQAWTEWWVHWPKRGTQDGKLC